MIIKQPLDKNLCYMNSFLILILRYFHNFYHHNVEDRGFKIFLISSKVATPNKHHSKGNQYVDKKTLKDKYILRELTYLCLGEVSFFVFVFLRRERFEYIFWYQKCLVLIWYGVAYVY